MAQDFSQPLADVASLDMIYAFEAMRAGKLHLLLSYSHCIVICPINGISSRGLDFFEILKHASNHAGRFEERQTGIFLMQSSVFD